MSRHVFRFPSAPVANGLNVVSLEPHISCASTAEGVERHSSCGVVVKGTNVFTPDGRGGEEGQISPVSREGSSKGGGPYKDEGGGAARGWSAAAWVTLFG